MTLRRRYFLFGGLGAAGAAGGVWWAGRQERLADEESAGQQARQADESAGLWALRFPQPGGGELVMAALRGRPLVLNFWATWCPPCVEELPLLDRFYQENARNGWQVLGIAVDQLAAVQTFLSRTPVRFPVGLAGMEGIALSKTLGNLSGGLPFTVVLGSTGQVLHRKIGRVSAQELLLWSTLK